MSWRDGNRFEDAWKTCYPDVKFDESNPEHLKIKNIYEDGYKDGFREGQSYDTSWDAD